MSTLFSYTAADGTNPLWPGIQYAGESQAAWRPTFPPANCICIRAASLGLRTLAWDDGIHILGASKRVSGGCSGPDPRRPEKPSMGKLESEQMLCASTIDLSDCRHAADLRQFLARSADVSGQVCRRLHRQ